LDSRAGRLRPGDGAGEEAGRGGIGGEGSGKSARIGMISLKLTA
jgi:hypothetical protein